MFTPKLPTQNFFAQPNTSTTQQSFFPTNTQSTPSSIFKPTTNSTTNNTNFLGGMSNQPSTPSFYKQPETNTSSTANIFSSFGKPQTGGLSTNTGSIFNSGFPSSTNNQPLLNTGGINYSQTGNTSMGNINLTQMSNKKEMDKQEIMHIIFNYISSISIQSQNNQFKLMVYNRIDPRRQQSIQAEQEFRQRQRTIDGKEEIFVDYNLWNTALQKNPNRSLYYPFQLNCPKNLLQRCQIANTMQRYIFEYIIDYQKKINGSKYTYDVEIQDNLSEGKKKLAIIKKSQIAVISKLEKLAIFSKRAEKIYNLESSLIQKMNQIKSQLLENENLVNNIEDISAKTSFINQFAKKDDKENLSKEKFQKNLYYFKELKNVFDTTYETLNNDNSMLSFIQSEIENTKKYGSNNY